MITQHVLITHNTFTHNIFTHRIFTHKIMTHNSHRGTCQKQPEGLSL